MTRLRFAFIGLVVGIGAGLLYGWVIRPLSYIDTAPDSLRADFQTDYVLMVAEVYGADGELDLAVRRLASLGPTPPDQIVVSALEYALKNDFGPGDLALLNQVLLDLRTFLPTPEIPGP